MADLNETLRRRRRASVEHRPELFRLASPEDARRLAARIEGDPTITVFDTLDAQLRDLVKTRMPDRKPTSAELDALVEAMAPEATRAAYGVWVFYPWSGRLVHVLDRAEFVELRTNRNRYKLTQAEQDALARRRVGVIGLSVGQAVAITMALERGFGSIRLADFDAVDLSNLNRLRVGVHDLGVPKVWATAREIAEIDPFLEVECFAEGLSEDNLDAFFLEGGRLDLVVEECDAIEMKLLARQYARAHRIPVIMETSDRGMMDVERFDLEPERPILHGLVEGLDPHRLKGLSNEDKVPHVLAIIGQDTMSARLKGSLVEVEQSIKTWPQLASAVMHGGGAAADTARRILLGHPVPSGRSFIDFEQLVGGAREPASRAAVEERAAIAMVRGPEERVAQAIALARGARGARGERAGVKGLDRARLHRLIAAATTAPSGGNVQPWAWVHHDRGLALFYDRARSMDLTDYQGLGGVVALGCAAETLILAAHGEGIEVRMRAFPDPALPDLVAWFDFGDAPFEGAEPHDADALGAMIGLRHTNRRLGERRPLPSEVLGAIVAAARSVPGADLLAITDDAGLDEVGRLIGAGDRIRLLHRGLNEEMMRELRWTPEEARATKDGIPIETLELSATDRAGLQICRDVRAMELVESLGGGASLEKTAKKSIAAASAVGLITMPSARAIDYFEGGRAVQRAWLEATRHGVAVYPQTTNPYLFARLVRGGGEGLPDEVCTALRSLRARHVRLFPVTDATAEVLLFRLAQVGPASSQAPRRPVEDVLTIA